LFVFWLKLGTLLYLEPQQVGIIKDNLLLLNQSVDIEDIILVVLLWVASSWLCLVSLDLCMNFWHLKNQINKVVWQTGKSSVIAAVSCVLAIFLIVSILELTLSSIYLEIDTAHQHGKF